MFVCAHAELLCLHKHVNCVFTGRCVHERKGEREFFIMLLVGPMPTAREGILMIRRSEDQTCSAFAFLVTVGSALICNQGVHRAEVVVEMRPHHQYHLQCYWRNSYNGCVCTFMEIFSSCIRFSKDLGSWPQLVLPMKYSNKLPNSQFTASFVDYFKCF